MQDANKVSLGNFEIKSGKAVVSDPCYELDENHQGVLKVKKGKWVAAIYIVESMGKRVGYLEAHHIDHHEIEPDSSNWEKEKFLVGVDSGQVSIVDMPCYRNDKTVEGVERICKDNEHIICEDEPWYSICCDRTLNETKAGIIPGGVVSSSGCGDGCYDCSTIKDKKDVVNILVDFGLVREEEEEDWDEQDEEEDETDKEIYRRKH